MTIRISIFALAALLFVTVLATLSSAANAYAVDPSVEGEFRATTMLATGPLNLVVFEVSSGR